MQLPWWSTTDPINVRQLLIHYGTLSNDGRINVIAQIGNVTGGEGALLRLTEEDPSELVSWYAATTLRYLEDPWIWDSIRKLNLTDARPQVVALAGRAFYSVDRRKSLRCSSGPCKKIPMTMAVTKFTLTDLEQPEGGLDFAYELLGARCGWRPATSSALPAFCACAHARPPRPTAMRRSRSFDSSRYTPMRGQPMKPAMTFTSSGRCSVSPRSCTRARIQRRAGGAGDLVAGAIERCARQARPIIRNRACKLLRSARIALG